MAEVLIAEIDFVKLTLPARKVLRAAVFHAFENVGASRHEVPLEIFCQLAGLPTMDETEMTPLLVNASKALGIIELVNTESPEKDDARYGSWQLIQDAEVSGTNVTFQLYRYTYEEVIRRILLSSLADSRCQNLGETRREYRVGHSAKKA